MDAKRLGPGFWMNAGVLDKFLDEEFTNSDNLRFKKTFYDIMTEGEFWEFFDGPLVESIWQNDAGAPPNTIRGNHFIQDANIAIGALKLRQLRVDDKDCGSAWEELRRHRARETLNSAQIMSRLNDFDAMCYKEYDLLGLEAEGGTEKGPYYHSEVVHDGTQLYAEDQRCRVDPKSCEANSFPVTYVRRAYLNTSSLPEDEKFVAEAFTHRSCKELNASTASQYIGKAGDYHCDGYALIIPFDWTLDKVMKAKGLLMNGVTATYHNPFTRQDETKKVKWIDRKTRGLSFEMNLYNQNQDLFTRYVFFVELTSGGGFIPLHNTIGYILFDLEEKSPAYYFFYVMYLVWSVAYVITWCRQLYKSARTNLQEMQQTSDRAWRIRLYAVYKACLNFWLWFDFTNLVLLMAAWGIRLYLIYVGKTTNCLLQNKYYPPQLDQVASLTYIGNTIDAMNAMLVYLRIFYFLKMHPRLSQLTRTIEHAEKEILGILCIFVLVFFAFACMCYVVYGHVDENYRTLPMSAISLMLMLLGNFDYVAMREAHRIFTPIVFALFQILAVFLLFNMVIAVLGEAFETVLDTQYKDLDVSTKLIDRQWKDPNKNKRFTSITRNSLFVEIMYWYKSLLINARFRLGFLSAEKRDVEQRANSHMNPRIYWSELEEEYYLKKSSTNFTDNLQLTRKVRHHAAHCPPLPSPTLPAHPPQVLDDYMDEKLGEDKLHFLYNEETGDEGLILTGAKKMKVAPETLVEEMMAYHHYWEREMSQKTFTGSAEDFEEMKKARSTGRLQRSDPLDAFFNVRFAVGPQRRWEEQKAEIDQLKSHLQKITPLSGDDAQQMHHTLHKRKTDAVEGLDARIHDKVQTRIDGLICDKVNEIIQKIMTTDMANWIERLVEDTQKEKLGSDAGSDAGSDYSDASSTAASEVLSDGAAGMSLDVTLARKPPKSPRTPRGGSPRKAPVSPRKSSLRERTTAKGLLAPAGPGPDGLPSPRLMVTSPEESPTGPQVSFGGAPDDVALHVDPADDELQSSGTSTSTAATPRE